MVVYRRHCSVCQLDVVEWRGGFQSVTERVLTNLTSHHKSVTIGAKICGSCFNGWGKHPLGHQRTRAPTLVPARTPSTRGGSGALMTGSAIAGSAPVALIWCPCLQGRPVARHYGVRYCEGRLYSFLFADIFVFFTCWSKRWVGWLFVMQ